MIMPRQMQGAMRHKMREMRRHAPPGAARFAAHHTKC
jgi:hypothetical protein